MSVPKTLEDAAESLFPNQELRLRDYNLESYIKFQNCIYIHVSDGNLELFILIFEIWLHIRNINLQHRFLLNLVSSIVFVEGRSNIEHWENLTLRK